MPTDATGDGFGVIVVDQFLYFSITTRGFTDAPVFTHTREVRELPVSSFFESGKTAGSVKKLGDTSAREAL